MTYLIYNPDTPDERIHELKVGKNIIGRGRDTNIIVMHESLSRHHAEIEIINGRAIIRDLKSLNSTFVNEIKIEQSELKDGDQIRCGNVSFKFVYAIVASPTPSLPTSTPDNPLSIVKQVPAEATRVTMQDLLQSDRAYGSVLRIRQQDEEKRALDKLKILLEVSKELSSPEEPEQLFSKILALVFEIMDIDRGAILLVNENTQKLEIQQVKSRAGLATDYQFYSTKITEFVRQKGDAILTADARLDQRFSDSESVLAQAIHASMCVPLKPRDEVIGVLYVDNLSMSNVYSDEDVEFLGALANQAAIAIDNAQLVEKMRTEAIMRDKLERFFPKAITQKIHEEGILEIIDTEVTALFSDISRFTEISSTLQPRQVIQMLNDYFKVMVEEIVFFYEGTLEKYIGDALFAIWGAPYQRPDDPIRAVRAAIEMQWAVRRLNQQWMQQGRQPISIHIGLNSGKVAAGNIGSQKLIQYATIGDTTNVTSRICSAAQADEVLISQSTFDKLSDRNLPLEKIPPVLVKGKTQPLQLYRILWQQIPSVMATAPYLHHTS